MHAGVRVLAVLVAVLWMPAGASAESKAMTNQDVINMVKAKLPEDTVVMAVQAAKPDFDTSADGLIKLKTSGVSPDVIEAVISAQSGRHGSAGPATPPAGVPVSAFESWNPEEIILVDSGNSIPMRYLTPQMRSSMRGLGWGGMAQYAVLRGSRASLRLKSKQPEFLLAVPDNAQPESYYTIVSLAVRKNNSREIMVGGGYMSYSTGVATDRIVAADAEKLSDQSGAPEDFTSYRIKVSEPMPAGEYAVVLYNSQVRTIGFFGSGLDSYYDFGVD